MGNHTSLINGTADILLTAVENGEVRVNIGDTITNEGYDGNQSLWGPDGFISVPNNPTDAGAARAFYFVDGYERRVVGTLDLRFSGQAGTLEEGDRMIVTDGPCRIGMKKKTARVFLYTESENDPPVGGKGMILDISGKDGTIQIRRGGSVFVMDGSTIKIFQDGPSSRSSIEMTDSTITLMAGTVNIAGDFVTLAKNSDGTLPGKPGVDTVILGAVGQSGVASPKVFAANY